MGRPSTCSVAAAVLALGMQPQEGQSSGPAPAEEELICSCRPTGEQRDTKRRPLSVMKVKRQREEKNLKVNDDVAMPRTQGQVF